MNLVDIKTLAKKEGVSTSGNKHDIKSSLQKTSITI